MGSGARCLPGKRLATHPGLRLASPPPKGTLACPAATNASSRREVGAAVTQRGCRLPGDLGGQTDVGIDTGLCVREWGPGKGSRWLVKSPPSSPGALSLAHALTELFPGARHGLGTRYAREWCGEPEVRLLPGRGVCWRQFQKLASSAPALPEVSARGQSPGGREGVGRG